MKGSYQDVVFDVKRQKDRGSVLAVFTLAACVFVAGATAWACVPGASLPFLALQPRSSGPVGSQVAVQGLNFLPGPVEIRWNGIEGRQLATTAGPDFSSEVTIPPDAEGLYLVVALSRRPDGSIADIARTPFQVTTGAGADPVAATGASGEGDDEGSSSTTMIVVGLVGATALALGVMAGAFLSRRKRS